MRNLGRSIGHLGSIRMAHARAEQLKTAHLLERSRSATEAANAAPWTCHGAP